MKKLAFVLIFALSLGLLAGCGQTEPLLESFPTQTEPVSTQEPEPLVPEFSVQTNYSRYVPKGDAAPMFGRLREEWIPNLEAGENYGRIYPFAGSALRGMDEYSAYRYGMIDEIGRIIADATYDAIDLVRSIGIDQHGDYTVKGQLPMWCLMRIQPMGEKKLYGIATMDGNVVTECRYSGIYGNSDGYVLATEECPDGSVRFDLYDLEGTIVFRSEELSVIKREGLKLLAALYSEDRFMLCCRGKEQGSLIYYYTDWVGTELIGPYSVAGLFQDGYALVSLYPKATYAFINKAGEIHMDLEGYDLYFTFNDTFWAENEEQHNMILDRCGKVIYSADLKNTSDKISVAHDHIRHSGDTGTTYYDLEGNMLYEAVPEGCYYRGGGLFNTDAELFYWDSRKSFPLKTHGFHSCRTCFTYGLPYVVCESGQDYALLNEELEIVADQGKLLHSYVLRDHLSGKNYLMLRTEIATWIYGKDPAAPLCLPSEESTQLDIFGGRILYVSQSRCAYYSLTGELLFSYPLQVLGSD